MCVPNGFVNEGMHAKKSVKISLNRKFPMKTSMPGGKKK